MLKSLIEAMPAWLEAEKHSDTDTEKSIKFIVYY